jgi:hypothetical protein
MYYYMVPFGFAKHFCIPLTGFRDAIPLQTALAVAAVETKYGALVDSALLSRLNNHDLLLKGLFNGVEANQIQNTDVDSPFHL